MVSLVFRRVSPLQHIQLEFMLDILRWRAIPTTNDS